MSGILIASSSYPASNTDPFYSNVSLLLHLDGANGSTTITNNGAVANTCTAVNQAQISTAQSVFGGASLVLDGTADYVTSTGISSSYAFGTGNFTVEGRVRFDVIENTGVFQISTSVFPGVSGIALGLSSNATGNKWLIYHGTTQVGATAAPTPSPNTWYAFAVVRNGNNISVYIDGTSVLSTTTAVDFTGNVLGLGGLFSTSFTMDGFIDEFRITKGIARYTANYTVATQPFPNS